MRIEIDNETGTFELTELTLAARWSGDYQRAARSLDVDILSTHRDGTIPVVDCPLGAPVRLYEEERLLFDGFVVTRPRSTEGSTITLSCFDRGFYLANNYTLEKFEGVTAEAATTRLAGKFGIPVGALASTGVQLTRLFLTGRESLYDIIATMYTLASHTTGEAYHIGFRGGKLCVTAKQPDEYTLVVRPKSNLMAANVSESIEGMVNTVEIYDQKHQLVRTEKDDALVAQYGRLQRVLVQGKDDDKTTEARGLLEQNGVSQRITVDCLGNTANMTGGCVVVKEAYTGVYGLFWIDSDTHEWKRGQYYNKLVLNYRRRMDEKEAGSLPNADGKATKGKSKKDSGANFTWHNLRG